MNNPDRLAELEEKLRVLTIQNNARGVLLAGYDARGLDRRAEHLARQQLDSQREANARLTDEVEALQARLTAAEAARDEAMRELETERLLHQVSCEGCKRDVRGLEGAIEAETFERYAAERERDAAVAERDTWKARAEKAEGLIAERNNPRLFTCPKCGSERGWLPQCMQDGCPVLGLEGEEVSHAE